MFSWNETKVNSTVRTSCFYGPPEVDVVRFCNSNNSLTVPDLEMCRTIISSRFADLENVRYHDQMSITETILYFLNRKMPHLMLFDS